jgi:indole-3-glycerol phosphate synthase
MMFLDKIFADVVINVEKKKKRLPIAEMANRAYAQPQPLDFALALRGESVRLIAEVKKASPSKGIICPNFNPADIARIYAANGAAAISVLTEPKYFLGKLEYLQDIKKALAEKPLPLLRKDFIVDPYQVYEARAYGADCLLLIVAILNVDQLSELLQLTHRLGMKALVEVHNEREVDVAVKSGAKIIGINNRDLSTFQVDLKTTARLCPLIPPDRLVVSESGIKTHDDMRNLWDWVVNAALIGEALITAPDIAAKMRELL